MIRAIKLMWLEFWISFLREFNEALKRKRLRRQYKQIIEEERRLAAEELSIPPEYLSRKQRSREWN